MMKSLFNLISFTIAGVFLLITAATIHFWPASYWFEVRSLHVSDTTVGDPVLMVADRDIKRNFLGTWTVSIRKLGPKGQGVYCTAVNSTDYEMNSQLPDPLTLSWWTFPHCDPLPEGKYYIRTTWTIKGNGFFPDKQLSQVSNIFEIRAKRS